MFSACNSLNVGFPTNIPSPSLSQLDCNIDPNASVYGVPFGSREQLLIEKFGSPTGIIYLDKSIKAAIYGKRHLFLIYNEKLSGVVIGNEKPSIFYPDYYKGNDTFDNIKTIIKPGIWLGMSSLEAFILLKDKMEIKYGSQKIFTYETEKAICTLHFAATRLVENNKELYLVKIRIEYKVLNLTGFHDT